jgi:hypothetical protein
MLQGTLKLYREDSKRFTLKEAFKISLKLKLLCYTLQLEVIWKEKVP